MNHSRTAWTALPLLAAAAPALAHHAMDGALPATFAQGLLSGLAHPVIGLDHLLFVLAIGLLSALAGMRRPWLPVAFVLAAMAGTGLHLLRWPLPLAEAAIGLSLLTAGVLLWRPGLRRRAWLLALAGVFHGYAYGEAIVGAESTPLLAYLSGLCVIQAAIAALAFAGGRWLQRKRPQSMPRFLGVLGGSLGILGAVLLGRGLLP